MDLLACEILAVTGDDPAIHYEDLEDQFGKSYYKRLEAPATLEERSVFKKLTPEMVKTDTLAGEPIEAKLTRAPGNDAPIGGLKLVAENGWVAVRPSGTEDIYKIYAESFKGEDHLEKVLKEGQEIVQDLLRMNCSN